MKKFSGYNDEDPGVAVDFVTNPPVTENSAIREPGRQGNNQNPIEFPSKETAGFLRFLLNNPLTKLSQQLLDKVGLNSRIDVQSTPGQGLTIDRELGAFGVNHRDRDTFEWTRLGPSFRKSQTLDAYGAELGQLSMDHKFKETQNGTVEFQGCNDGDLLGGIFGGCNRFNGLQGSIYNTRFDPRGVSKFLTNARELLDIISKRKR